MVPMGQAPKSTGIHIHDNEQIEVNKEKHTTGAGRLNFFRFTFRNPTAAQSHTTNTALKHLPTTEQPVAGRRSLLSRITFGLFNNSSRMPKTVPPPSSPSTNAHIHPNLIKGASSKGKNENMEILDFDQLASKNLQQKLLDATNPKKMNDQIIESMKNEVLSLSTKVTSDTELKELEQKLKNFTKDLSIHSFKVNDNDTKTSQATAKLLVDVTLEIKENLEKNLGKPKATTFINEFINKDICGVSTHRLYTTHALLQHEHFPEFSKDFNDKVNANILYSIASSARNFWTCDATICKGIDSIDLSAYVKANPKEMENYIKNATNSGNAKLLDTLLKKMSANDGIPDALENNLIDNSKNNITILDVIISNSKTPPATAEKIIEKAVTQNKDHVLQAFLEKYPPSSEKSENLAHQAIQQGNLSMAKMLTPNNWAKFALNHLQNHSKGTEVAAMQFYLNSNVSEFDAFAKYASDNSHSIDKKIIEYSQTGGKLIARFPDPEDQKEVFLYYGKKYESYESQQLGFGTARYEKLTETMEKFKQNPNMSLKDVYQTLSGSRPLRSENDVGTYITPIRDRYAMFQELVVETLTHNNNDPSIQSLHPNEIKIHFDSPGKKSEVLTSLEFNLTGKNLEWIHAKADDRQDWFSRLDISKDWNSLVKMKVNEGNKEEFQQKVAEFYWKGAQLCPTLSGNSQTMLELHQMLYLMHDLPIQPLSRRWVLPDCVALCNSKDRFVNDLYTTCFDK